MSNITSLSLNSSIRFILSECYSWYILKTITMPSHSKSNRQWPQAIPHFLPSVRTNRFESVWKETSRFSTYLALTNLYNSLGPVFAHTFRFGIMMEKGRRNKHIRKLALDQLNASSFLFRLHVSLFLSVSRSLSCMHT